MKYVIDILTEVKLLGGNPRALPTDSKPNFWDTTDETIYAVVETHDRLSKKISKFQTIKDLKYKIKYSEKIGSNHREHG